jgi:Holliday junction resolvasome RuvABC endonuclease subunit
MARIEGREVVTALAVPMGPRVLAIDLALQKTGIAMRSGEWERPKVWTYNTNKMTGEVRDDAILAELDRAVGIVRPEIILLEDLFVPQRVSTGWVALAFLHGVVRRHLRRHAPLMIVNNTHIKVYGTGNGNADKAAMILCVERRYSGLVSVTDDNQADAFTLMALGCHAYGYPLVADRKLPDTHLRALTMVTGWPDIAGHESPAGPTATTRGSGRAGAVKA